MGVNRWLAGCAAAGAHVLVAEAPGSWATRVAVEQEAARCGWRIAEAPADGDVLVVTGSPGPSLSEAVDRIWEQMPGPRSRVAAQRRNDVVAALDTARAQLVDLPAQRRAARQRPTQAPKLAEPEAHREMDQVGMDHDDMDMSGPGGVPLAEGGPDRDGLEMDVLTVPLGPVLPHWPPGIVLRCRLQGDVVTEAELEVLDTRLGPAPTEPPTDPTAVRADAMAALLSLAGWDAMAAQARHVRDLALSGSETETDVAADRLHRRLARSRILRWSLRGLGPISDDLAARHGLPAQARGDAHDRLLLLSAAIKERPTGGWAVPRTGLSSVLPEVVGGLDLAAVRLVVASLVPWLAPATTGTEARRA